MPAYNDLEKKVKALEQIVLEHEQANKRQKFQRDFAIELTKVKTLAETLNKILSNIFKLNEFDSGGIYLIDKKTNGLNLIVHQGLPKIFLDKVKYYDPDDIRLQMIMKGDPIYQKVSELPAPIKKVLETDGIHTLAVIPIKHGADIIGAINLASHTHDIITDNCRSLLEAIAEMEIGVAITRVYAEEELRIAEQLLQNAHDELEKKVQKRTKELVKANELLISEVKVRENTEKQLVKSRERLRDLTQHLQSSKELERISIAREIHDDLGQILTAVKMNISWLEKKIHKNQKQLIQKAGATIGLVDQTIRTVKKIITELRPGLLDDLGITAAMEWYAEDFINRTQIQVELQIDISETNLHPDPSTTIFRIFQECLTNIARHSKATEVKVNLTQQESSIKLLISDNGIGITEAQIADRNSFGILGIKERVHIFGGEVEVYSLPDKGTAVNIVLCPIKKLI